MKLLLTRTAEDNEALKPLLADMGIEGVSLPLFTVERLHPSICGEFDAVIATSRNATHAAKAFAHLPFYVVGEKTAETLAAHGCTIARAAPDAARLLPMLPKGLRYLYLSGEQVREDFQNTPHNVQREVVYRTLPLPPRAFSTEGLDGALFFSPTSVRILHALYARCDTLHLDAYCISQEVAQKAKTCFTFHRVYAAEEPTLQSLLQCINETHKTGQGNI